MPEPGAGQILVRVTACGVCRTDLHVVDGELPEPKLPIVPGHEIVGEVARHRAPASSAFAPGERVGVPWLGYTCGRLPLLPRRARRTCAMRRASPAIRSTAAMPSTRSPTPATAFRSRAATPTHEAAPLLCAGLIGYRSLRMAGEARAARASTASAPRRTSSPRSRGTRAGGCTPSRGRATTRRRRSRARSARCGPAARTSGRPRSWTPRSSSRRSARWSRRRCAAVRKGGVVVAAAST